jgi:hypothetical protein
MVSSSKGVRLGLPIRNRHSPTAKAPGKENTTDDPFAKNFAPSAERKRQLIAEGYFVYDGPTGTIHTSTQDVAARERAVRGGSKK